MEEGREERGSGRWMTILMKVPLLTDQILLIKPKSLVLVRFPFFLPFLKLGWGHGRKFGHDFKKPIRWSRRRRCDNFSRDFGKDSTRIRNGKKGEAGDGEVRDETKLKFVGFLARTAGQGSLYKNHLARKIGQGSVDKFQPYKIFIKNLKCQLESQVRFRD